MPGYDDMFIRDKKGHRVAVKDCHLEPLNLFLPGVAPVIVPKRTAWRTPAQQAKDDESKRRSSKKPKVVHFVDYEADDESEDYDSYDGDDDDDVKPLIKKTKKSKAVQMSSMSEKCKKDSVTKDKHSRRAERHRIRAEREREESAEEQEKLQRRIEQQETYIAKLKARYAGRDSTIAAAAAEEKKKKKKDAKPKAKKVTFKDDKPTTRSSLKKKKAPAKEEVDDTDDGSTAAAVRAMLEQMKIRGGGGYGEQPGDLPWNDSDNSRLVALRDDGETWANIATALDRNSAGEVKRQHKHLMESGWQAPGANEMTDAEITAAEKTGEETTEAEATSAEETTDAEATGAETTDAEEAPPAPTTIEWNEGTDNQLWKLKQEDKKTWAEIHAEMGGSKSGIQKRFKTLVKEGFQPTTATSAPADEDAAALAATIEGAYIIKHQRFAHCSPGGGNSAQQHTSPAHGPGHAAGAGSAAYIETYSRDLLAAVSAGRARVPQPDEVFDESDCLLLALAESRRRKNRWLEIQADFANVTGRLVPVEILKWKLAGRGEDGEGEKE